MSIFTGTSRWSRGSWWRPAGLHPTMYASDGTATAKYYLESAWPSQVEISGLKAARARSSTRRSR